MNLPSLFLPEHLVCNVQAETKKRALEIASEIASNYYATISVPEFLSALSERERISTTAIGHGIAIPHARIPHLNETFGIVLQLNTPIDFNAEDNQPVDL